MISSQQITKRSGSNLALAFFCLPKETRKAMGTFYAFCRIVDDVVDDKQLGVEDGQKKINLWRKEIDACYEKKATTALGKELMEIIHRYEISKKPFEEILNGVEMDLLFKRYDDFEALKKYCYRVASAVGLVSIKIFGCKQPQSEEYAVALGMAFQLTNILRDVKYDLEEYGRIYIPQDEMKAFGVTEDDLRNGAPHCKKLFHMMAFRAEHYYNRARRLIHPQDRKALSAALIMTEVYHSMLEKIRRNDFNVLKGKISLTKWGRICAVVRALWEIWFSREKLALPKSIAVFGGGFAGMSAAIRAAEQGHCVEIFENKPFLGGRAHSYRESKTGQILDNSQHVIMGCYRTSHELFRKLGITDKFTVQSALLLHFISPSKGVTELKASNLPPPFHFLTALLGYKELSWLDRFSILLLGILLRLGLKPSRDVTMGKWLRSFLQTPNAIRALWEPLGIAALNEPICASSARLFYEVVSRSLFGSRDDSALYFSKVGWSDLVVPEAQLYLRATGGDIFLNTAVKEIQFAGDKVQSFITSKGETISKDLYISALPWYTTASLLPQNHPLREQIQKIQAAPIVGIYLWTDRPLLPQPAVGLLDSPIQWVFDHDIVEKPPPYISSIVISAAYDFLDKKPKEILDVVLAEIHRVYPESQKVQIQHSVVYKARDATIAARPETAALRPKPITPWKNFFLAGDWTDTGLPSTLESATLSGARVGSYI